MSKKPKFLEKTQRELVHSKFILDQRYTQTLKPYISDWFKKMKPLPDFSRIFQDYNKRYFTLNLAEMSLYYSSKERYSLNEITYIQFEEIQYVSDKPHYALSNQGIEWKDAFGFTIYLSEKYIVLVAQSNEIYMLWLNYFEAIRIRSTGKSILNRTRTPYYSNLFAINFLEPQVKLNRHSIEKQQEQVLQNNKENQEQQENQENQEVEQNEIQIKQQTPKKKSDIPIEDKINSEQKISQIQEIAINKKLLEERNMIPIIIEEEIKQQPKEQHQEFIIQKQIEQKKVKLDFLELETIQKVDNIEDIEDKEQIIQLNQQQNFIEDKNNDKNDSFQYNLPKRLDKRKNSLKKQPQIPQSNSIKINSLNIWQYKEDEQNLVKLNNNIIQDDSQSKRGLFLDLNGHNQHTIDQIEQPELIIRFDQLDSSRWSDQK